MNPLLLHCQSDFVLIDWTTIIASLFTGIAGITGGVYAARYSIDRQRENSILEKNRITLMLLNVWEEELTKLVHILLGSKQYANDEISRENPRGFLDGNGRFVRIEVPTEGWNGIKDIPESVLERLAFASKQIDKTKDGYEPSDLLKHLNNCFSYISKRYNYFIVTVGKNVVVSEENFKSRLKDQYDSGVFNELLNGSSHTLALLNKFTEFFQQKI